MADLPFVTSPPGDAATTFRAAAAAAKRWGLPSPVHLRTGMNALYLAGENTVLRVSRTNAPPGQAVWLHWQLQHRGIRVPRMMRDEVFGFDALAVFALEFIGTTDAVDWRRVGEMVSAVHEWPADELVGHVSLPAPEHFPWWQVRTLLHEVEGSLDDAAQRGLKAAIDAHGDWVGLVGERVVCHGDVHPGNVLQSADGPVLLDWDLICWGPRAWDHAPLMSWAERWGGDPAIYPSFAEGYGSSLTGYPLGESLAVMRNVAATLMRVRAGRNDPAAAKEAEHRLRYWRGDADAPPWQAQ